MADDPGVPGGSPAAPIRLKIVPPTPKEEKRKRKAPAHIEDAINAVLKKGDSRGAGTPGATGRGKRAKASNGGAEAGDDTPGSAAEDTQQPGWIPGYDETYEDLKFAHSCYVKESNDRKLFREWKLSEVDPVSLIGRRIKVLWEFDAVWYLGTVSKYNRRSCAHLITYVDGDTEWRVLAGERVRVETHAGEVLAPCALDVTKAMQQAAVEAKQAEDNDEFKKADDEMEGDDIISEAPPPVPAPPPPAGVPAVPAPGEVIWARMKGHPVWPTMIITREDAMSKPGPKVRPGKSLCMFYFGTYELGTLPAKPDQTLEFLEGLEGRYHLKQRANADYSKALKECEAYLLKGDLPPAMQEIDGLADFNRAMDEIRTEAAMEGDQVVEWTADQPAMVENGYPKVMGPLTIHSLGIVQHVWPAFHNERYIFPVGYRAIRAVNKESRKQQQAAAAAREAAAAGAPIAAPVAPEGAAEGGDFEPISPGSKRTRKDRKEKAPEPEKVYIECLITEGKGSFKPVFTCYVVDASNVRLQGPFASETANRSWMQAMEAAGVGGEGASRVVSGPRMFGFGDVKVAALLQALPNADRCERYAGWIGEKPPVPPPDRTSLNMQLSREAQALKLPRGVKPIDVALRGDHCHVCGEPEEYEDNQFVQCDRCRVLVHMECYGVQEIPDGGHWLCATCELGLESPPPCCLCPVSGGAMKLTTENPPSEKRWCHVACAMWTPECTFVDIANMEPIDGIRRIGNGRWNLKCVVCKQDYGSCIQCSDKKCYAAYHPLCARAAGFRMGLEMVPEGQPRGKDGSESEGGCLFLSYCNKHKVVGRTNAKLRAHGHLGAPTRTGGEPGALSPQGKSAPPPNVAPAPSSIRKQDEYVPPPTATGCARGEPFNPALRRGQREPDAVKAMMTKRLFMQNTPYLVTGCMRKDAHDMDQRLERPPPPVGGEAAAGGGGPGDCGASTSTALPLATPPLTGRPSLPKAKSLTERYEEMHDTEALRITAGKSAIHGWGVFVKKKHAEGDMVIEYAGELVRPMVGDLRERRAYDAIVGAGTYMFRVDEHHVIDATRAGNMGHLLNHACQPNCFSRTVNVGGPKIIIFALRDLEPGEELTYDYRFSSKTEMLTCNCSSAVCRGVVNEPPRGDDVGGGTSVPKEELEGFGEGGLRGWLARQREAEAAAAAAAAAATARRMAAAAAARAAAAAARPAPGPRPAAARPAAARGGGGAGPAPKVVEKVVEGVPGTARIVIKGPKPPKPEPAPASAGGGGGGGGGGGATPRKRSKAPKGPRIPTYVHQTTLGCPKCRYMKGGCGQCRVRAMMRDEWFASGGTATEFPPNYFSFARSSPPAAPAAPAAAPTPPAKRRADVEGSDTESEG